MKEKNKLALLALASSILASCGGGNSGGSSQLNLYLYKGGFGTEWLSSIIESFESDETIKDKFGDVTVKIATINASDDYATSSLEGLSNKYDIYFGMNLQKYIGKKGANKKLLLEDLTDLYDAQVPGEDTTLKEKMLDSARSTNEISDAAGNISYYTLPWSGGYNGIMYNPDILSSYNIDVPVTTDELVNAAKKITLESDDHYSIIQGCSSPDSCYWTYLYPTWWAQYEGYEQYINFWHGKLSSDAKDYSDINIFKQQGRLASLTVLENLFADYTVDDTKYNNLVKTAESKEYMTAQKEFFQGKGAFMACGDWYHNEMANFIEQAKAAGQEIHNVRMMRTPVHSSIISRLETINDDATLSKVIKAVDEGKTSYEGVSDKDFASVVEARQMLYSTGNYHTAVIPTVSAKKDLAKAFLSYLATDKANDIYIRKTGGSCMFFKYDIKNLNPSLYASLNDTSKMMMDLYNNEVHAPILLPIPNNFRIFREGGVSLLNANSTADFEVSFRSGMTAEKYYEDDINYWTEAMWQAMKRKLGVK
ncbi:MAG: extracellular solute-binding protein [Bacilli bacterium]|nr:extracellular solute-binding protein [Bacilli bacterium]